MKKSFLWRTVPTILLLLLLSAAVIPADAEIVKGTVSITSEPEGADIYLNDEFIGRQTNAVILDVFPGIHFVRLELPGYRTWEKVFEVKEGQITYISHNMEAVVGDAFSVSTKPQGARIYIDGEFEGISNIVLNELPAGQHSVLLTLDNYSDYAKTVTINEGMSQSLVHTFEPVPTTGEIIFESVPSNAGVFLNGEFEGNTRLTLEEAEPGTYDVIIRKAGYDDWAGKVDVAAGKISEVKAELTLSKVILQVETVPENADLYIDGVVFGKTPLEITIGQGRHTIRAEKFGYETAEETVDIGAEGASFSFVLISMAPQAIEEAESTISENLIYNPKKAQELLDAAIKSYDEGDSESAINYAESAISYALDVDSDGVDNPLDISPNLNNLVIYVIPFIILFLLTGLLVKDIAAHRIKPEIILDIPKSFKEDDMLVRAHVTAGVSGGSYRGFVCTVYIDGVSIDHFTDPGKYDIMLSGRSPGEHNIMAHLQVAKERYGRVEKKAEETFTVEMAGHHEPLSDKKNTPIIDTEEYSPELNDFYETKE